MYKGKYGAVIGWKHGTAFTRAQSGFPGYGVCYN